MEIEPPFPPEVKLAIDYSVLKHASICQETNCQVRPTCTTVKRIIEHSKICCRIGKTDCLACRALFSLSYDHAKGCLEIRCDVPYCEIIKMQLIHCELEEVHKYLREQQAPVYSVVNHPLLQPPPHVNQPQHQASPDPNQAPQQAFEELELPPLKASPELNQPPRPASPYLNLYYPPQQAASLVCLLPQQDAGGRSALHRRVRYRRVARAGPAHGVAPQAPAAAASVGIILNAESGPVPPRIRVKRSTYVWIARMMYG